METKVYFIRHAEPDISVKEDLIRPLSRKGYEDTRRVTEALADKGISVIYSSPYKRSIDTIKHFADMNCLEINTIHDFRERCIGEWVEDFKTFTQKQWEDFEYKLSAGECLREVQERNISALHEVLKDNIGRSIAIATHGTALSTIINYYNPDFRYNGFRSIIDKMPCIVYFRFDGMEFISAEELEV
ncbi:MAG: histidine phosphatase family protein [Bacillota bacterium]